MTCSPFMLAPVAKLIDWSVLQLTSLGKPPFSGQDLGLEEALQFIKGPDFVPVKSEPAQVKFDDPVHFRFATPRPSASPENSTVHGRFYRCPDEWRKRPVIILLHGWNSGLTHRYRFARIGRWAIRAGFNAATLELPYHFQRRPRWPAGLPTPYFLHLAEMRSQAVAEIRALTGWLLEQGCPAVALWGSSYGGWLAGLIACRDARPAAVVMAVPGIRMKSISSDRIVRHRIRQAWQAQRAAREALDSTALNLIPLQPLIPPQNILLIEAIHDVLAKPTEELWCQWGQPEIWRVPHGHFGFSIIGAPCWMARRVLRWLGPRLDKTAGQPQHNDTAPKISAADSRRPGQLSDS